MAFTIRPAHLQRDLSLIVNLLVENVSARASQVRYEWLYLNNPSGLAKAWVAPDSNSEKIVGTAAIFPRTMYVHGVKTLGWVLGDFCVSSSYRSLGPAIALQRACLNFLQADSSLRYYDFPSQVMLAVYRRLQVGHSSEMSRAIKVLTIDKFIQRRIPVQWIAKPIIWSGNLGLKLTAPKFEPVQDVEVQILEGPWGEEFSQLSKSLSTQYGVYVDRSSDYLNWRFYHSPLSQYQLVVVRKKGILQGFSVIDQSTDDVTVLDCFGVISGEILEQLLKSICFYAKRQGKASLQASVFAEHWMTSIFEKIGFRMREQFPLILSHSEESSGSKESQEHDWFLMAGDRDS